MIVTMKQNNKIIITGEHRCERSAEGQWCGADLPGHQMMISLLYDMHYQLNLSIDFEKPITSHEFYPGPPAEGVEFRHLRLGFCA